MRKLSTGFITALTETYAIHNGKKLAKGKSNVVHVPSVQREVIFRIDVVICVIDIYIYIYIYIYICIRCGSSL